MPDEWLDRLTELRRVDTIRPEQFVDIADCPSVRARAGQQILVNIPAGTIDIPFQVCRTSRCGGDQPGTGLADLAQIEKRRERLKKQMRTSKEAQVEDAALERIQAVLENALPAASI